MSDEIHPLVSQPPSYLNVPEHLSGEERIRWVFEAALDHINMHAMAWPARGKDGQLRPPPDEHVLDYLARSNELVDEERAATTIPAGTVSVLGELPECDLCNQEGRYDAEVEIAGRKGGAYLCLDCYLARGSGTLGANGDVYLMRTNEVSDWVRATYDNVAQARGKLPLG